MLDLLFLVFFFVSIVVNIVAVGILIKCYADHRSLVTLFMPPKEEPKKALPVKEVLKKDEVKV